VSDEAPNLYELCLGIASAQRSPSHYQLLDVKLFERDPQTINRAADRQSLRVRAFASADRGDLLAGLLAEIETARSVLVDPDLCQRHDRELCAALFPSPILRPSPPPVIQRNADTTSAESAPRASVLSQIIALLRPHA